MKYIVRGADEKEYGPVDQEVLVQWVASGRVTSKTEVRNTLMKSWTTAVKIPFLEEALMEKASVKTNQEDTQTMRGPQKAVHSLLDMGPFRYTPANPVQRLMAWAFDMGILGIVALIGFTVIHLVLLTAPADIEQDVRGVFFTGGVLCFAFVVMIYYLFGFAFKAQTIGQWFWGLMVVQAEGEPVYAFRAMVYMVLYFLLMPLAWLCIIMPQRRSLQEILAGIRVVKIAVRD